MHRIFKVTSIVLVVAIVPAFFLAGCNKKIVVGRSFDFISHFSEAEVVLRGERVDPIRFLGPTQPWTEDSRNICPAMARTEIHFREVPLGANAQLRVGLGLRPRMTRIERAPEGEKAGFTVYLDAGGTRYTLLEELVELKDLAPGEMVEKTVPLPPLSVGFGNFIFSADGTAGSGEYNPVWCGPLLTSEGRAALPAETVIPIRKENRMLLDTAAPMKKETEEKGEGKESSGTAGNTGFRADFDEEGKDFFASKEGRLLIQEAPASNRFRLEIPENAHLTFGVAAIEASGDRPCEIVYEIRVNAETVYKEQRLARNRTGSKRISIPLEASGEDEACIELITRVVSDKREPVKNVAAVWIHPVVETTVQIPRRTKGYGKNVLLLVVDALRADHLSMHGYERPTTPSLDKYGREGVVFSNARAQSSWTIPSTATLFTGQYSYTHGLYDAYHWFLVPGIQTLTQAFLHTGVRTAAFVANRLISDDNNFATGFELFHEVPFSTAAQLNASFLNWLDGHGDEPFFAYIHYMEPHMPYAAPGKWLNRFGEIPLDNGLPDPEFADTLLNRIESRLENVGSPKEPEEIMTEEEKEMLQQLVDLYDSEILYWDDQFRLLMEALITRGLFEDTVIVITSDHGEEFLDHGKFRHGQSLHAELLHVPLIMLNAQHDAETRHELVGLLDVAPTLLALSKLPGTQQDVKISGQSGLREGEKRSAGFNLFSDYESHDFLFAETAHGLRRIDSDMHVERAVLSERWKAIFSLDDKALALYDRISDSGEKEDISSKNTQVQMQMIRLISEWVDNCRATAPYNISVFDASALEKLREMGYVK